MKLSLAAALIALLWLPSCRKPQEVVVTETRRVTMSEVKPKLNATSDERFKNTQPSLFIADVPSDWKELGATQFRLLNYRFGEESKGEVWVSLVGGGLLHNINRWLGQFGQEPVDAATLQTWGRATVGEMGAGTWIEAKGSYAPGMGRPSRANQALAGIIIQVDDRVLTIKMVGPEAEVPAQIDALKTFAAALRMRR